ncbi:MAG: type I 3-dehydroquinate dehydratase [Bacteroidales bacterium]
MICVSVSSLGEIRKLTGMAVELIELRLDLIGTDPGEIFPVIPSGLKTIATCRPGAQKDSMRSDWLVAAIDLGANMVDVELEADGPYLEELHGHARENGVEVIVSYHQFDVTPDREFLKNQYQRCFERGGDIAKVATQIQDRGDLLNLLSLYQLPGRKVILGMGPIGRISRVIAPYLGSEFTFASPGSGLETAPGQLDFRQLTEIYKVIDQS